MALFIIVIESFAFILRTEELNIFQISIKQNNLFLLKQKTHLT